MKKFINIIKLTDDTNLLGGGVRGHSIFEKIIGLNNLFSAWKEFKKGKTSKPDVQEFEFNLEDNLFQIHEELKSGKYRHGSYASFYVKDPKLRHIHKATVKDRVIHHAVFRVLYPIFDKSFVCDSYSCRIGKGMHVAVNRLEKFIRKSSKNNSRNIYALKCDVKKFFDSIDKEMLLGIIKRKIQDGDAVKLISVILGSFSKEPGPVVEISDAFGNNKPKSHYGAGKGLPLGNVTSQLFENIYLNELDQYIKHQLKIKYYLRYCDDFIILSQESQYLLELVCKIGEFLEERLKLNLHPNKVILRKHGQGIDFLGYVVLPYHRALRTKTKRRAIRKIIERRDRFDDGAISEQSFRQSLNSYLGMISHCNGYDLENEMIWLSGLAEVEI